MNSRVLPEFELLMPRNISEALNMITTHRTKTAILAGGTDLLLNMKLNKNYVHRLNQLKDDNQAFYLISLSKIDNLKYINYVEGEGLKIGAKVTVADVLKNQIVKEKYPALWEAASTFATPQIRNRATVIGNVVRASPAGDCSCAILALGGKVVLQNALGQREVRIDDFWISYGVTAKQDNEIAVELRIDDTTEVCQSAFQRMTRTHEDLSKLNVAVRLEMEDRVCRKARLAMGCVAPIPKRLVQSEKILEGKEITPVILQQLDTTLQGEIFPIDDQRSTAEYRRVVSAVLLKRLITRAIGANF